MKLVLEHEEDGIVITLGVGEFSPYFLGLAHQAAEEKFGTIDVGGTDEEEEEWMLLELDETDASLHDVAEFVEKLTEVSGMI